MPKKATKKTTKKALKAVASDPTDTAFFDDIRRILRESRRQAYAAVNAVMVEAYWKIGRRIIEEEQAGSHRAEYGTNLIRELSRQLGEEFGKGFSVANLKNFRQFYLTFPDPEKSYAVRNLLSWPHLRLIMRVERQPAAFRVEVPARFAERGRIAG